MINQLAGNTSETYIEENGAGINYVRTNDNGLAFNDASASGIGATAVGYNSVAEGDSSVAIGQGSSSSVDTGIALGSSSVSSRVIVKGSRNTSVTENGVVIGYDTTDGELLGALSIGDDGKYRQIINAPMVPKPMTPLRFASCKMPLVQSLPRRLNTSTLTQRLKTHWQSVKTRWQWARKPSLMVMRVLVSA